MKRLSNLKLSSIIFGILMCLPMFSILARVIYVQSNPNAKESYYGETINDSKNVYYDLDELVSNQHYYLQTPIVPLNTQTQDMYLIVSNVVYNNQELTNCNRLRFYYTENYATLNFYNSSNNAYPDIALSLVSNTYLIEFTFISTYNGSSIYNVFNGCYYQIEYNDYSYIDNVFDYSLSKFLEEDNYSLDFFNFFENVFLNQSGKNMLYINFLNWYMNYALLVSSAYCLFFVLYFFINMIRQLVMSFTNKIDGGF